jgi:hypothetical protein
VRIFFEIPFFRNGFNIRKKSFISFLDLNQNIPLILSKKSHDFYHVLKLPDYGETRQTNMEDPVKVYRFSG